MIDGSNFVITNNQSDISHLKIGKLNITKENNLSKLLKQKNYETNYETKHNKPNMSTSLNHNLNILDRRSEKIEHSQNIESQNKTNTPKKQNIPTKKNINVENNNNDLNLSLETKSNKLYLIKLSRFFSNRKKIIISIFLIIYNMIILIINIFDFMLNIANKIQFNFMNKIIVFVFQIIGILMMLSFHIIMLLISPKYNHYFLYISIVFVIVLTAIRIFIFIKNQKIQFYIIINLIYSLFISVINVAFLILTFFSDKKKKHFLQNIEEIMNFTGNNQQTQKKENDINISNKNKLVNNINQNFNNNIIIKGVQLVEDERENNKKEDNS